MFKWFWTIFSLGAPVLCKVVKCWVNYWILTKEKNQMQYPTDASLFCHDGETAMSQSYRYCATLISPPHRTKNIHSSKITWLSSNEWQKPIAFDIAFAQAAACLLDFMFHFKRFVSFTASIKQTDATTPNIDDDVMNIWKSRMWTAEWTIKWRMIIAVIYATFAVAKRKPGLYGIRNLDLCDTGAALYQLR